MIFLISGSSHTGKTALAQRLLEKYKYPYLSIDHLKMGLIRSGQTALTVEEDDKLTEYLWPIVCEMIKMAIENKQNLIVEGCYIPYNFRKDFEKEYLAHIRELWLIFSEEYIKNNYKEIIKYENVIEERKHWDYPKEIMIKDNKKVLEECKKYQCEYILINKEYDFEIDRDSVLTSERLIFRRITKNDFNELSEMLKDLDVMYAWEHSFSDEEIFKWIEKRNKSYKNIGYDYLLAIDKKTSEVVGQIGLLDEVVNGKHFIGLGYILKKKFWHKGFATEGAKAMLDYAFNILKREEVIATIRVENKTSCDVAENIGMRVKDEFIKIYKEKNMIHLVYSINKEEWEKFEDKNR
ncbi:GNAT family N-acetyltransferase [uncultured Clostridium sp.]|uniref:GNAT family N-acetyltransferase n=1 Tax=uncultured Clostridium sp. TaxID=59620 RepID=UPI00344CF841